MSPLPRWDGPGEPPPGLLGDPSRWRLPPPPPPPPPRELAELNLRRDETRPGWWLGAPLTDAEEVRYRDRAWRHELRGEYYAWLGDVWLRYEGPTADGAASQWREDPEAAEAERKRRKAEDERRLERTMRIANLAWRKRHGRRYY